MGRPRTGSLIELDDGRWRAGVPAAKGDKARKTATFDDRDAAELWRAASLAAVESGHDVPDPDVYRQHQLALPAAATGPVDLRTAMRDWHRARYQVNERAQLDRERAVLRELEIHFFPYCDAVGIVWVQQFSDRAALDLARWMAGRTLEYGDSSLFSASPLSITTAGRVKATVSNFFAHAVRQGWVLANPFTDVEAMERVDRKTQESNEDTRPQPEALELSQLASVARFLSPTHQLVLWLEVLAGCARQGEAFGIRLLDVEIHNDLPWLHIHRQGGRKFDERDPRTGRYRRSDDKHRLKTHSSRRRIVIPWTLYRLIQDYTSVYHADPSTDLDRDARLVPGIREEGQSGQATFGQALRAAVEAAGLNHHNRKPITPHHLRKCGATLLKHNPKISHHAEQVFIGHANDDDVFMTHYALADPRRREQIEIARWLDAQIDEELGGQLRQPTRQRQQWGRGHQIRLRLDDIEARLIEMGWRDIRSQETVWLRAPEVAQVLGISPQHARRLLRDGRIPATQRLWGTREIWMAHVDDVQRCQLRAIEAVHIDDVAEEFGWSYVEVRSTLIRLGNLPAVDPQTRRIHLEEHHVRSLRQERDRLTALHERAMPVAMASAELNVPGRTVRDWVARGLLNVDPETDSSGHRFVTRESVARHQATEEATSPRTLSWEDAGRLMGRSVHQVRQLVKAGELETLKVGRRVEPTAAGVAQWMGGIG